MGNFGKYFHFVMIRRNLIITKLILTYIKAITKYSKAPDEITTVMFNSIVQDIRLHGLGIIN